MAETPPQIEQNPKLKKSVDKTPKPTDYLNPNRDDYKVFLPYRKEYQDVAKKVFGPEKEDYFTRIEDAFDVIRSLGWGAKSLTLAWPVKNPYPEVKAWVESNMLRDSKLIPGGLDGELKPLIAAYATEQLCLRMKRIDTNRMGALIKDVYMQDGIELEGISYKLDSNGLSVIVSTEKSFGDSKSRKSSDDLNLKIEEKSFIKWLTSTANPPKHLGN